MDEPFSGLDPVNSAILREAFLEMRARGKTIIFSTHQMETVEALCEAIVIVDRGRVVVGGPVRDVKRASGRQVVRIALDGDGRADEPDWPGWLAAFPGVRLTRPGADYVELTVPREIDPQAILHAVLERGERVARFEIADPSLEEIFIERVGVRPGDAEDLAPAGDDPAPAPGGDAVSSQRAGAPGPGPACAATPGSSPGASIATGSGRGRSWRRPRSWRSSPSAWRSRRSGCATSTGARSPGSGSSPRPSRPSRRRSIRILDDQLNRPPPGADPAAWERPYRFEPVATVGRRPGGGRRRRPARAGDDRARRRTAVSTSASSRRARRPAPAASASSSPRSAPPSSSGTPRAPKGQPVPFGMPNYEVVSTTGATDQGQPIDPQAAASRSVLATVLIVLIFVTLTVYGMWVATSVAAEKSSRVMELLISAATPRELLVGKVVGVGGAGLTQYAAIIVPAALVVLFQDRIATRVLGPAPLGGEAPLEGLTLPILGAFLLFFILGFILYALLYAAAGSLVSRQEDVQQLALPLSLISMASYIVAVAGIGSIGSTVRWSSCRSSRSRARS